MEFTATNGSDHVWIGIDRCRFRVTKDLVQLSVAVISLQMRQDRQLLRFEKVAIANRNQIVIDHMQHELLESQTIGNGATFGSDGLQIRAAFDGIVDVKCQLGIAVFGVFESDKGLRVTQCLEPER